MVELLDALDFWHTVARLAWGPVLEWLAAGLTIYGAWLLANKGRRAAWGFVLFLAANLVWICFAWLTDLRGLLAQQLVLTLISLQGIWKGLIAPALDDPFDNNFRE